ncbi:MAG: hypothetical protein VX498_01265 [Myxococcota bacterium]|nr:hypothetical protein [Myxococcota bacterium]
MRIAAWALIPASSLLLGACGGQGQLRENPEFSDAARYSFAFFESEEEADLAFAVRQLEREVYLSVDVEASSPGDRSLVATALSDEDVAGFDALPSTYPEGFPGAGEAVSPAAANPVAVAGLSAYGPPSHSSYLVLPDQTATEPGSPSHYDRLFLDGSDECWPSRSCDFLRTHNNLTKNNLLLTITYEMFKDYRWVDLNLPDPGSVAEGEAITNDGSPRWAFVARSWNPEVALGSSGNNAIYQSYSIEVWIPRDGEGFVRDGSEQNADGGSWEADSIGGGSLRMLALWAESNLGMDPVIESVVRNGIDDIFRAQEAWLDAE